MTNIDMIRKALEKWQHRLWVHGGTKEQSEAFAALSTIEADVVRCPSCRCIVDQKGYGHHSAADCIFMHLNDPIGPDAKPKEPSEDVAELVRSIRDDRYLFSRGVALIAAHDDAIRRECADRAEKWYMEGTRRGEDNWYDKNANELSAAILATKPAREESK